jgi:hypothetical protein
MMMKLSEVSIRLVCWLLGEYVASKMNMTAKTCYRHKKSRWSIEDMHRDGKQYCGMKNICAWKKESLLAHYAFLFFLWWEYCKGVDQAKRGGLKPR